jgi:hypothetical protein
MANRLRETPVELEDFLKEALSYDPVTGHLWWKNSVPNKNLDRPVGRVITKRGYLGFDVKKVGKKFTLLNHRVAWFLSYGVWPRILDHINGTVTDNRIGNLREATEQQNQANTKKGLGRSGKEFTSKYKGVHWDKTGERWIAKVGVNYKKVFLGSFSSEEEAAVAYNKAATKIFGEYAVMNNIEDGVCERD